jgi:HK97 family phage prohead protease
MALKELSGEGSLKAVISTFQKDRDGDVMTREAFKGSEGKSVPLVWSHNWDQPIGKGLVKVGDESAEFHGQFNLDTTAGLEAYKTVKAMGDLQQYSIGFRIIDASRETKGGESVRVIKDIELFEASPVLVGAAYGTHTIAVKEMAMRFESVEEVHTAMGIVREEHARLCTDEECPMKVVRNTRNADRMKDMQAFLASLKGEG